MLKGVLSIAITLLFSTAIMYAGTIKGKVTDTNGKALIGANVVLLGTNWGAATDTEGNYEIENVPNGSYTIAFSFIGYQSHQEEITVADGTIEKNASLTETQIVGEQVIVSASRKPEKITEAPATIDIISAKEIEEIPGNPGELFGRVKGVDYVRTGLVGIGINVRGFNSAFNPKMLQMDDNRLSNLIATGLAYGPLSPLVKDDIDRIEVILGPSAALYGPNAHNGLVYTLTKDPRRYPGITMALSGGSQNTFSGRFRYASAVSNKFAYKISAEYSRGTEFDYTDSVYNSTGAVNLGQEIGLDRNVNSIHGGVSFYYSPTESSDFILTYGGSNNNYVSVTNAGRNQIVDWRLHIFQLRYVSPRVFGQVYYTLSRTDETFALNQRTQNYWSFKNAGFSEAEALERSFTEQWAGASPTAGVALARGAVFKDNSDRVNAELQYNNNWNGFNVILGGQYQFDMAGSRGTYLLDNGGHIDLTQYGFYGQIEKNIVGGLKAIVAARADDHEKYGFNFIPKGGFVYSSELGSFRLTYGKGIAAPTILNLEMNIFAGLALGNGEGFTLSNGSKIDPLKVETIQTIEGGYKGVLLNNKLFVDVNGYYNMSENFISPLINIAPTAFTGGPLVTLRGNEPISKYQSGLVLGPGDYVLANVNFGKVQTYGFDVGLNIYANDNWDFGLNYSFFDYKLDETDITRNDGNKDGKVDINDLPLNTPKHKGSVLVNYHKDRFFGSVFARWAEAYNFFSGINVASETIPGLKYSGKDVIEGQRVYRDFNEGPLGGIVDVDLTLGYRATDVITVSGHVVNLLDSKVRDFVASPAIGRMVSLEFRVFVQ